MSVSEIITKYWGLILFLGGLCFHAIYTYFRVGAVEKVQDKHDIRIDTLEKTADTFREDIKVELKGIKTRLDIDLPYIKEAIRELKDK